MCVLDECHLGSRHGSHKSFNLQIPFTKGRTQVKLQPVEVTHNFSQHFTTHISSVNTLWRAISARLHRRGARIPLNIFKIHAGPLLCRPARAARFAARRRSVAPAERTRWARELLYLHQGINGHILSYLTLRLDSGQNPWYLVVSLFFEIEL